MGTPDQLVERLNNVTDLYTKQFTIDCKNAVDRLINSEVNEDIYCFLVLAQSSNFYFSISINSEAVWNKGYGSVDDLDPFDASLMGTRYQNIGYPCETSCDDYEEELRSISYEAYKYIERCRESGDQVAEKSAKELHKKISTTLLDIAVNALNNTDFSQVNKTPQFCAMVVGDETDYAEQAELAKRTMGSNLIEAFDELFPELEPREPKGLTDDIASLPNDQQAEALVQNIIDHHLKLNHYEGSNRFAELLNEEVRLIQLRPASDSYIARAIDEFGPQVESYGPGTKEFEEERYYSQEFYLINALLDMAGYSEEPLTTELEESLNRHIEWLKNNCPESLDALALLPRAALHQWGKGKYPSPV